MIDNPLAKATKTSLQALNNIERIKIEEVSDLQKLTSGCYQYVDENDFEYDFLIDYKESDRIFVLFSGFVDRDKLAPPVFHRWKWSKNFPGTCIYVADPALKKYQNISNGWYVGDEASDVLSVISEFVKRVADIQGIPHENIISYGSSGGGFAAIRLHNFIDRITAVAINPQTDIFSHRNRTKKQLNANCFPSLSFDEGSVKRLSLIGDIENYRSKRIVYVQNKLDVYHYTHHMKLFYRALGARRNATEAQDNLMTILFEDSAGHGKGEPVEIFEDIISKAIHG